MPRNSKPPPHGPSPIGNKMTTDLQEFAAPSTLLDREILEGFSTGSNGYQPEPNVMSKHESSIKAELDGIHQTKKDDHQGDSPGKHGAFFGEAVGHENTGPGPGVGSGPESLELTNRSVSSLESDLLPEKKESTGFNDSSAKIEAPIEEGPGSAQTAKIEAAMEKSPVTKLPGKIEPPMEERSVIKQIAKIAASIEESSVTRQTGKIGPPMEESSVIKQTGKIGPPMEESSVIKQTAKIGPPMEESSVIKQTAKIEVPMEDSPSRQQRLELQ